MVRILLVDDERFARQLYSDYLMLAGYEVDTAESAEAAVELLAKGRYGAVVTDLVLPGGDGLTVLAHVKGHDPDAAVIVITGLDLVDPAVRAIKSGASEYLVKPVTPEALQLAVSRALAQCALLREHQQLKRSVALFETCQRLATQLDGKLLPKEVAEALQRESGAAGVVVLANGAAPLAFASLAAEEAEALAEVCAPAVSGDVEQRVDVSGVRRRPRTCVEALLVPLGAGADRAGTAVLVGPKGSPDAEGLERARIVARTAGQALRTASRIASAQDLVYVDDLTRLFNTRYLDMVLEREVAQSAASGGTFAVLFLDLDLFKRINDQHGHLVGSQLLVEVGRVVRSCVRDLDVVSRWGGDEFAVVLINTDSGGALKVAERIRRAVEEHAFLAREGLRLRLTTCIGVAAFPEHARDRKGLLDLADRAMYRGKGSTRNVVYVAAPGFSAPPPERRHAG